ncbi:MAG: SNF2-related protein, partial [Fusobacteria bacterium]|nr:SNF2-related protein [Fusobacteriota bacterium]
IAITKEEIQKTFGSTIFTRGAAYFNSKLVVNIEIQEVSKERVRMTSMVVNEKGKKYLVDVTLKKSENLTSIMSECTCPYGVLCKHAAAALLRYNVEYQNEFDEEESNVLFEKKLASLGVFKLGEKSVVENLQNHKILPNMKQVSKKHTANHWLSLLEEEKSSINQLSPHEEFVIYELSKVQWNDIYTLAPYITKKNKRSGETNVGKASSFTQLAYKHYRHYLSSEDIPLIELGESAPDYYNQGIQVKGKIGYLALREAVNTGRLFYQKNRVAIRFSSENLKLEQKWKESKDGFKLISSIALDSLIIPTLPLLKLDPLEGMLYEIESSMSLDEWKILNRIASVSEEELAKVHFRLEKLFPQEKIEKPAALFSKEVDEKLRVKVKISGIDKTSSIENELSLFFSYGGYTFRNRALSAQTQMEENDQIVTILRDVAGERAAVQHILALQLEQISESIAKFRFPIHMKSYDICFLWDKFLNSDVEKLESYGYEVVFDEKFSLEFENIENIYVESTKLDWFSLHFTLEINGKQQPLLPMIASFFKTFEIELGEIFIENLPEELYLKSEKGKYCKIKKSEIEPILKTILQLYGREKIGERVEIALTEAHLLESLDYEHIKWKGSREVIELSEKLRRFESIEEVLPPKSLTVALRPYQQEGINWLNFLHEYQFCGILADDMGLGKTIQTLAHLSRLKELGKLKGPSLLIVPTSLLSNWKHEIEKFTPNLTYVILHGKDRNKIFENEKCVDLMITTYSLALRDCIKYSESIFDYIILDEAQKIKNASTKMGFAIRSLKAHHRLALSGTPIENHLGELWSIFHFLMPGFLKSRERFNKEYRKAIEQSGDRVVQKRLNRRVAPFILRRTKEKVASELPEKTIIIKMTQFEERQGKLYEGVRLALEKQIRDVIVEKGIAKSQIIVLDALLKLRQICCHPQLLKIDEAKKIKESAKFELFKDLVAELLAEGRKILVFSQFTEMIGIIEKYFESENITYAKLTGSTVKREQEIEKFQKSEVPIFLISLKAGGVGLNLVEADSVIHYDPWWNPAVENQATDRAHRIGQDKKVFVYKLIVENSIESKIIELQERKRIIQEGIYSENGSSRNEKLNGTDLLDLLKNE